MKAFKIFFIFLLICPLKILLAQTSQSSIPVFSQDSSALPSRDTVYSDPRELLPNLLSLTSNEEVFELNLEELVDLLNVFVDTPIISRYVIASRWRALSVEERKTWISVFAKFQLVEFFPRLKKYKKQLDNKQVVFKLRKFKELAEGRYSLTYDLVYSDRENSVKLTFLIFKASDEPVSYKIYNLIIEGINVAIQWRKQYTPILESSGFQGLVNRLNRKIEEKQFKLGSSN